MDEPVIPRETQVPERALTEVVWGTSLNYCHDIPLNLARLNYLENACRLSRTPLPAGHAVKIFISLHDLLKSIVVAVQL